MNIDSSITNAGHINDRKEHTETEADGSLWYTVKPGDTLPEIAQHFYQDAQKYMQIFAANESILEHPDSIVPGVALRIPPALRKCAEPPIVYRKNSFIDWSQIDKK